ncbi:MAG: outer membrane protein assembly factor BamA [Bacteroidetes bacterium]|nr:MAG: outer membrane protein assembly factor BamA [Bacteroidota bacterium]
MIRLNFVIGFLLFLIISPPSANAQVVRTGEQINIDYNNPREYTIGGISVSGVNYMDHNIIVMVSQLNVGDRILVPGEDIARAIDNIWRQGLFTDVSIGVTSIQDNLIFLDIELKERPRLTRFEFTGARRSDVTNLTEKLNLVRGDVVTESLLFRARSIIEDYYVEKGFLKPEINIRQVTDTARVNSIMLEFEIDRGDRTRIREVIVHGNEVLNDRQIKRLMKNTRERSLRFLFNSSKLVQEEFKEDKQNIIDRYNELGKRDAVILRDTFYFVEEDRIKLELFIDEGPTYYFRSINWVGNTVYPDDVLTEVLGLNPGDIYNQKLLDRNLFMNMEGVDVSSLYLDNGYLFFNITPMEVNVSNDSIDLELRIYEGPQAEIARVTVSGNTKTNDHVILREIRTRPGMLFSRSEIIRSQRDIIQLGYFDQEKIDIIPTPNAADGTVDLEYIVEETSSDQIELSGGWGANQIIGTLGLSFNNFSTRNFFKKDAWRPLPSGDGQRLSLRAQTYGRGYVSYSMSFMEPWLGGKKPNALSVSIFRTVHRNRFPRSSPDHGYYSILGTSLGMAQRLRVPDDFFYLRQNLSFQRYEVMNSPIRFIIDEGNSNNFSYGIEFGRNSVDAPLYPRTGSEVSIGLQITPPYSLLNDKDYSQMSDQEKYRWLEYHKWKFNTTWYTRLAGNLVLSTRTRMGFLGYFNPDIGVSPFERFYLGGDGLTGWNIDGREIISMRGYANYSLTPQDLTGDREFLGANVYNKFTAELRYPVSLNPMATIYGLVFAEAGNAWGRFRDFNPFELHRSAGFGVRIFLPMFGLLGLDWGYGFDEIPGRPGDAGGRFHFSIGQQID